MKMNELAVGKNQDRIPNFAFKGMAILINLRGLFPGADKRIEKYGIKPGFTVVDYGCGTGNYLKKASELVGDKGKVYAVDVHPLSRHEVETKIAKNGLQNVSFVLAENNSCAIPDKSADLIYALDMFHMVKDHLTFLTELHRILKPDGILIIENGHQSRQEALTKIASSKLWKVIDQNKEFMKCSPK